MSRAQRWMLVGAMVSSACHCESKDDQGSDGLGSSGAFTDGASGSSDASAGTPFDASRWIGRYHYENPFLPFGERDDPMGTHSLMNFAIFEDSTASLFYDDCSFDRPTLIAYAWVPSEEGWLSLFAGAGEPSLRFGSIEDLETLRVHLVGSCRELEFEADGVILPWTPFHPGESCWVDRCTTGNVMQVDYCEGEEPPPCP